MSHRTLRHGKSRSLRIGTLTHQCKYTFLSDLCKALQIDGISEYRCVIYLEVSCVYHDSYRRVNGKRGCILDTVVGLDKFHSKISEIDHLSVFYFFQFRRTHKIVLFQFVADQSQCQLCSIDWNIDLFQYIRKGSDMILVSVGDHKSLNLGNIFLKIGYIRDDQIDSQHIILRERKSTVYHYNTVFILKSSDVHSDLFQTAKWYDLKF